MPEQPRDPQQAQDKSAEEQYLEELYLEANVNQPVIRPAPVAQPAPKKSQRVPIAKSPKPAPKPEPEPEPEKPPKPAGKSEEELYLEQLYNSKDLPDGAPPLHMPSLQDSQYQFSKIKTPEKSGSALQMASGVTRTLSLLYLISGFIMYFQTIPEGQSLSSGMFWSSNAVTARAAEVAGYSYWAFLGGAAIGALGIPLAVMRKKRVKGRVIWLLLITAISAAMALYTRSIIM